MTKRVIKKKSVWIDKGFCHDESQIFVKFGSKLDAIAYRLPT
jgi:hypothetical protein